MISQSPEFWQSKARALLTPSPFSQDDKKHGERERKRLQRIHDVFGTPELHESALIEECMRDARDAHVPADVGGSASWQKARHPLTGKPLVNTQAPDDWFAKEHALLAAVEKDGNAFRDREKCRDAYVRLWYRAMKGGENMPGSFVLPDHSIAALRSMTAALVSARARGQQAALLYMHVGPVQGFIRASRRTHDLWMGSYIIGYLAMRAIRAIANTAGIDALVYPDLAKLPLACALLRPDEPSVPDEILRSSLANRFLAIVALDGANQALDKAHDAAREAWRTMAECARASIAPYAPQDQQDAMWVGFDEQLNSHLDIDAVVQPWPQTQAAFNTLLDHFQLQRPPWLDDASPATNARTGAGYGELFNLCHRTLTAYRKTTLSLYRPGDPRPKCSQCGQREQMVPPIHERQDPRPLDRCLDFNRTLSLNLSRRNPGKRLSLQLAGGEGLCTVCWTKRMAPESFFGADAGKLKLDWGYESDRELLRFPGVVSIAAAPFRYRLLKPPKDFWQTQERAQELPDRMKTWLDALDRILDTECLNFTPPGNLIYGLRGQHDLQLAAVARRVGEHDGEWFYAENYEPETAWRNHFATKPQEDQEDRDLFERFERLKERVEPARRSFENARQLLNMQASPYYAVLVLDVDDMGKWLTGRHDQAPRLKDMIAPAELAAKVDEHRKRPVYPALHRELARRLARLAIELHTVVDRHLGRMVYSGGDDVMAFLPLATALPCARAIMLAIHNELGDVVTASAGLAIAHMRMPLSRTLDEARKAEGQAKRDGKNRLTVHIAKRSGAPVSVTFPWRVGSIDVIETLIELLRTPESEQDDETTRTLARVDIAYRLEQEFTLLQHDEDSVFGDMLLARTRALLQKGASEPVRRHVDALVSCLQAVSSQDRLHLLLLMRFLMREEHGIDTLHLLEELDIWPQKAQDGIP